MNKTMWTLAVLAMGAGLTAVPAMAQDASAPPPAAHAKRGNAMANATADLNLTADQQKTVDAAEADAMTKMKALREDTSTDPAAKRKQMVQIQKDTSDKIRAVLTDDQKTKFDAKMAEMREQMKARRAAAGGDAAPAGAAPAGPPPATN